MLAYLVPQLPGSTKEWASYSITQTAFHQGRYGLIPTGFPLLAGNVLRRLNFSIHDELELPEGYEIKPYICYWLKKNGELNKFINMKQLMKLYDDKKDLFKAYVKKNDVTYNNQESIVQLIKYLETN